MKIIFIILGILAYSTVIGLDKAQLEDLKKVKDLPLPPEKLAQLSDKDETCQLNAYYELAAIKSLPRLMRENLVMFVDFKVTGKDGKLTDYPDGKSFMFFINKDHKIAQVGRKSLKDLVKTPDGGGFLCEVPPGEYQVLVLVKGPKKKLYGTIKKCSVLPRLQVRLPELKKLPLPAKDFLNMAPFYKSNGKYIELFASATPTASKKEPGAKPYHVQATIGFKKEGKIISDEKLPDTAKISFILIGKEEKILLHKTFKAKDFLKNGFNGKVKPGYYQILLWADIDNTSCIATVIPLTL